MYWDTSEKTPSKKAWDKWASLLIAHFPRLFFFANMAFNMNRYQDWLFVAPWADKRYRRTLDLGCGKGLFLRMLLKRSDMVVGLDGSEYELGFAKKLLIKALGGGKLHLVRASASQLPFKDGAFDLVWSNCVIEHIEEDGKVFAEGRRCLTGNGEFIVTLPNSDGAPSLVKRLIFRFRKGIGRLLASRDLRQYLEFTDINDAEEWLNINRWQQVRRGYTEDELDRTARRLGLRVDKVRYYLSGKVLEFWDLATFSRLNDVFPLNFFLLSPVMHLLNFIERGTRKNAAVIGVKFAVDGESPAEPPTKAG